MSNGLRFTPGIIFAAALLAGPTASGQSQECLTNAPRPSRGGRIEWREDIEAALAEAHSTGLPSMLYFSADW